MAQNERSGSRGWLGVVGKVYKLLQKVKTKYLAMSPVMDIYERLFMKQSKDLIHSNFFNKTWWVKLNGLGAPGGLQCVLSLFDKLKVF